MLYSWEHNFKIFLKSAIQLSLTMKHWVIFPPLRKEYDVIKYCTAGGHMGHMDHLVWLNDGHV